MAELSGFVDAYLISILNGFARGFLLFTLAAGLSLLFGLMDVLNLAHGSLLLIGGYLAVSIAPQGQWFLVAVVVALVVGGVLGAGLAAATKPLASRGHLDQALLTLGFVFILGDIMGAVWGKSVYQPRPPELLEGSVSILGQVYPVYRLAVIAIGAVLAVSIYFAFERSRMGAVIRAAVSDRDMVEMLGINVRVVFLGTFIAAGSLAAVGGVVGGPILGVRPGLDVEIVILALIVVVIGGLGSITGALVGSLLIGQMQSLGITLIPAMAPFLLFGTMALVLSVRPTGLFGIERRH